MTNRSTPQQRYAEAKAQCEQARKDLTYWEGVVRLLEEAYSELRGLPAEALTPARRGRYREVFAGDRRIAIADAIVQRGGRARDIDLVRELEADDLVIPTRERDPAKHFIAYLKRVRQSLSGNRDWFTQVDSGILGDGSGEEWREYEVTQLARDKVGERFGGL